MEKILDLSYILNQSLNILFLVIIQFGNGLLVIHKNVKVNYTRKINHFLLFFIPIILNRGYAHDEAFGLYALGAVLAVAKFGFYIKPVRDKVPFIDIMFRSFDRPEDRPRTLLWIVTQTAAGYLVLVPAAVIFACFDLLHLVAIPILIYGIGDGLAEPIGVRFGKHKYRAYALFTDKKYARTLEGSAAVFVTSLVIIAAFYNYFTASQFIVALAVIPVLMTVVEAFSPHTWDSPTMFFAGHLSLFAIMMFF